MLGVGRLGGAVLAVSIALATAFVDAQEAVDIGNALSDGRYEAEVKVSRFNFGPTAFAKTGTTVTGYVFLGGPTYCFQGSLQGNTIQVLKSRVRKEDEDQDELRPYRILPVPSHEEYLLQSFTFLSAVSPLGPHGSAETEHSESGGLRPSALARKNAWIEGCQKYFARADEPPCNDPELWETLPLPGAKPTYDPSTTTVCRITNEPQEISGIVVPGGACSVDSVFEVMSTTAAATANVPDGDREQVVTDCGVLRLDSPIAQNRIRTRIDNANHRVTNSTLRGHIFYPGQVVREIRETERRVEVLTVGTGNADAFRKALNAGFGPGIWEDVDKELLRAFAKSWSSRTAEGFKRSELHDGTYQAGELSVYGASLVFRKRGDSVVGTYGKSTGISCFQGTITPTAIHVGDNVVRRSEDYTTKVVTFLPIFESDRDKFAPLRFYQGSIEPFPNPRALLGTTPALLARDTKWLNECSRHFGLPEKEPPRCGDRDLQDAVLSCETRSQYFRSEVACRSSKTCTAANVFSVMLKTPNAIATVGSTGGEAQDCGVLSIRVPGGGDARVRTEFDTKHNVIKIYTLPGHPFHPSTISRYVVDVGGRVDVNTEACGPDSVLAKMFADTSAAYVWEGPNKALKAALSGSPTPKKTNSATKKPGSATKKKP